MFNLGFWEMVVLGIFALVVVGPEKLPGLARNIGRFLNDLKRTTNTIGAELSSQIDEEKFLKEQKERRLENQDPEIEGQTWDSAEDNVETDGGEPTD